MKIIIDLPDDFLIEARKRAAELRGPLQELVIAGLSAALASFGRRSHRKERKVRWVTVEGGLPPGVDVSDRAAMHECVRRQR